MQTDKPSSLSEKFGEFGATPTEGLWNALSDNLNKHENRKKRGAFWWWFGGIAAGVLILFSVFQMGVAVGKNQKSDDPIVSRNKEINTSDKNNVSDYTSENNSTLVIDSNSLTPLKIDKISEYNLENEILEPKVEKQNQTSNQQVHDEKLVLEVENENLGTNENTNETGTLILEEKITNENMTKLNTSNMELIPIIAFDNFDLKTAPIEKRKTPERWELSFNVGSSYGFQSQNQKLYFDQTGLAVADNLVAENAIQGSGLESLNLPPEINAEVKRPLCVEFGISRKLGKRFSVESGINLNYFSARNSYNTGDLQNSRSGFLSVGIPIALEYDFIKKRRFDFSWVAGVNYEFPFLQHVAASYISFGTAAVKSNSFCAGYMISVFTAPRFSYRMNEKWSVGISTGMRYYFHQSLNSQLPVLKRNLWGGINFGLVWSL